ncbi:hypothetical protein BHE74_00058388 [Ensete ventricosum]|nr:hypothetical protein BHE74_00058388 [Ensete ventricosum]
MPCCDAACVSLRKMTEMEGHTPVALGRCSTPAGVISGAFRSGPLDHPHTLPTLPPSLSTTLEKEAKMNPLHVSSSRPVPIHAGFYMLAAPSALCGGFVLQQVLALNAACIRGHDNVFLSRLEYLIQKNIICYDDSGLYTLTKQVDSGLIDRDASEKDVKGLEFKIILFLFLMPC